MGYQKTRGHTHLTQQIYVCQVCPVSDGSIGSLSVRGRSAALSIPVVQHPFFILGKFGRPDEFCPVPLAARACGLNLDKGAALDQLLNMSSSSSAGHNPLQPGLELSLGETRSREHREDFLRTESIRISLLPAIASSTNNRRGVGDDMTLGLGVELDREWFRPWIVPGLGLDNEQIVLGVSGQKNATVHVALDHTAASSGQTGPHLHLNYRRRPWPVELPPKQEGDLRLSGGRARRRIPLRRLREASGPIRQRSGQHFEFPLNASCCSSVVIIPTVTLLFSALTSSYSVDFFR